MKFEDKTVFISGANRGIGKALIAALLRRGVKKIHAGVRDPRNAPDFSDPRVVVVELDITDLRKIESAARQAQDTQILINNAGVAAYIGAFDGSRDLLHRDMETNYFGTLDMMRAFIPILEKNAEPGIVNILSFGAFVHFAELGGYCPSKAALFSVTQGARLVLAKRGFSVHSVNPGPIDTEMIASAKIDKTSPVDMAEATLEALQAGEPDIFPDQVSRDMWEILRRDFSGIERMLAGG